MGFVGEVAALLVIALLALTGNALVAATLIRRSLLHHPSNRLVLSLTASNLLVVLAVVPGVIASMVMSGTATTVPVPDLRGYTDSGTIESSVLPRALQEPFDLAEDNQLISSGSLKTLKSLKSLKDSKPFDLLKEPKESEAVKTLRPSDPVKDSKPFELLEILRDSQPLEPLEDSKPLGPLEDSGPLEPLKEVSPPPPVDPSKSISPLDVGSHMIHVNETKSKGKGIKDEEGRGDDVGGNVPRKEAEAKEEESPTVEGRRKEILGEDADFYCRAAAFVTNLVSAASSLTVAIIALDRYLAIVRPMMYGTLLTGARCLLLLGCCWGHALLVALGPLLGWSRYERQEGEGWCRVTWAGHGGYAGVWVCTVVLLPLAVMAACYYFILQNPTLTPRSCLKRSQSSVLPRPSFRHKLGLASRKPSWNWESSPAKGFRTVCVVVGAQLVTWLPFTALAVIEAIAGPRHPHILPYWTRACAVLLLYGSSVFYPIVYGLYNRTIRKELRACLFPLTSSKALRAAPRRLSGRHSNSGSLLDFSPTHRIRRGSSERNTRPTGLHVSKSAPTNVLPSLTPTLEVDLPLGVAPGLRKPSQDSGWGMCDLALDLSLRSGHKGAIMVSYDDSDTDTEGSSNAGQGYRYLLRRGSAPCRLQSDPLGGAPGGSEFSYLLLQEEPSLPESSSQMVVAELHSQSYMDSPQESRRCGDASFYRRDSVATSLFGRRKTILSSLAESTKSLSQRTLTRSGSLDRLFDHVQRKDAPEEVCVTYKASDRSLYQALSFKRPPTGSSSKINIVAGLDRRASKRENLNFYRRDRPYVSIPKDSGILEEPKEEEEEEERGEEEEERGEELQRGDSGGSGGSGERVGMGKVNKEWVVGYKVESEGHGSINRVTSTDSMGSTGSRSTSHVTFFTGTNPPIASYHSKTQRQVSLDEGIGADCILEDLECE
ncbi:uncharacterized protein LOC143027151 isoform X4 [Oratosquilla oratoria]|uniref:uncharacterized protein LOC143027151 isoform X4 n=1 Tax=Oratosquilla oratoria TaxID=337810 RepID=UPI003F766595